MLIDLNSDLGESFGAYKIGMDAEVIAQMTSVNVACCAHAGDPIVLRKTIETAKKHGVSVGAHPGFPDLQGFGRRNMSLSPEEVTDYVLFQMGGLSAFLKAQSMEFQHVKAHGALYNMAAVDIKLAMAIGKAIKSYDSSIIYCGLAGSQMEKAAGELGLRFANEVFADRGYRPDGTLVPRSQPGAMIEDENEAATRVVRMVKEGKVKASDGSDISIKADTVCLHGDNAHAVAFAEKIRNILTGEGVRLVPMKNIV